jgi:alcohol dehydrogenase (NADP+)
VGSLGNPQPNYAELLALVTREKKEITMKQAKNNSRREFIRQSAVLGAGMILAGANRLFAEENMSKNIASRGYAARDNSGPLSPWSFERRPLGGNDILLDIKFCGICHSDIHQIHGDWGPQQYPQVPGHEITGVVAAVGKNVTKFKVGDYAGVGTMVDSCGICESCKRGEEQYCDNNATLFTYGYPDKTSPTGITQGGYSNNIVVKERFAFNIPKTMRLQDAASLLCAGITTYSPLVRHSIKNGDKVGVAGIGGLGHLAIKLAKSKVAEVYAFTTTESKMKDILAFGAKEAVFVDSVDKLKPYNKSLDYMISTIPVNYNVRAYASLVKPYGSYTQVGMPAKGEVTINNFAFNRNRVNYNTSLVGSIPQTQELVDYCAENNIYPDIQVIKSNEINEVWRKVVNKEARYRYVIDAATL